jgi:3-phenylpropionate/cinnamic acid dioxygenase small subunit
MSQVRSPSDSIYREIRDFLYREARLLDRWELRTWLNEMVAEDIHYEMPVRTTVMGQDEFFGPMYLDDNHYRIEKRIERLESEYAWAERPRSRVRHFITNIIVEESETDDYDVYSNFLVLRNQKDNHDSDMLFGERQDVLRETEDGYRLTERLVLIDQSTIDSDNISFFI